MCVDRHGHASQHRCSSFQVIDSTVANQYYCFTNFRKQRRLPSRMSFFQAENRCCSCDEVYMHLLHRSHLLIGTVFFQNCKRCCDCERCIWWYRCPACFKHFSSKQILIQHLEKAGHSRHDPQCGSCHKHCFCFESLREHLLGNSFVLFLKTLCWRLKSWSRGCLGYWMYIMDHLNTLCHHMILESWMYCTVGKDLQVGWPRRSVLSSLQTEVAISV